MKILFYSVIFYLLAVFQTSFIVHFGWFPRAINFVLILVAALAFFEKRLEAKDIALAFIAGFFLDVFSAKPFGYYIVLCLGITIILNLVVKKYVRTPILKRI